MARLPLRFAACAGLLVSLVFPTTGRSQVAASAPKFAIVIHGGAGTILRQNMTPEMEKAYIDTLTIALRTGYQVLARGGSSLDAVEATIKVMEDSPLFNAGKGAVFTSEGTNELDASIMDGRTLAAGAVAALQHVKNPISLARLVMEKSPHVMMVGSGAEEFARSQGVKLVSPHYFWTERRWKAFEAAKARADSGKSGAVPAEERKFGTVGAVALDKAGNLAAGTSTGGTNMKRFGRVGDSPIIGAGTYANNLSCAVSGTGDGEFFIRNNVAADICARLRYTGVSIKQAADDVVMKELVAQHGEGGVIAMDRKGNIAIPFNSAGMYRGWVASDGKITVKIYKDQ
ncbi:MAG: isoaspartyl peptidase/L-asparaginase [Gemmatimonadota bacterium]|nr:isoaspartyl peptidase/L-asparaginase [Gemmatimonadota bacterium]